MQKLLVVLGMVLLTSATAVTAADEDPIKAKLDTARKEFDAKSEKYTKSVNEWLDKKEETARKAGNKTLVDQIKQVHETFQDTGELHVAPPPDVLKILTGARTAYEAALVSAVKDYTKAKKDDEAAAATARLKEFREEIDPRTPIKKSLLGTWKITMGDYKAEWTFKEDGTLTSTAGNVKQGNWAIDLNRRAVLIVWGKDLTDKIDLPLNPKGTAGSQIGRENRKLEAVKVP